MKKLIFQLVMLAGLIGARAVAGPSEPVYSDDPSRVMWFVIVSDEHITARTSDGDDRLPWVLSDCLEYVDPELIINLGDLTDASNGEPLVSLYPGPQDDEWNLYRQIVDASGVTVDSYIDLPGNHDQYDDKGLPHYLTNSLAGRTFNRTQHSIVIQKPWGTYHLLTVDTTGNDGANWPLDNAGLDLNELVYIKGALEDNVDANMTLMFGHHPIVRPDMGFKLNEGSDEIQTMLGDYSVRAYFYGHTHEFRDLYWPDNQMMPVTLQENADSLGFSDENNMLLVAIDNDNMHVRQVTAQEFPWVMVTTPADINQGGGNPWAYDVPAGMENAPIRSIAFTSDPFVSCEYSLDGGAWTIMDQVDDHVYQGFMDTRGMTAGNHTVEVRALPGPTSGHKITFRVVAYTCGNGLDDDGDGLTDYPDDPGCDSVTDADEYNDPVLPEPVSDVIEQSDAYWDAADVGPDQGWDPTDTIDDDMILSDLVGIDTGTDGVYPYDAGLRDDGSVQADRLTGLDEGSPADLATVDSSGDDTGGDVSNADDGGCTTNGRGQASMALLLIGLAMLVLGLRRRMFN